MKIRKLLGKQIKLKRQLDSAKGVALQALAGLRKHPKSARRLESYRLCREKFMFLLREWEYLRNPRSLALQSRESFPKLGRRKGGLSGNRKCSGGLPELGKR